MTADLGPAAARYDAFLSYSHGADSRLAPLLQRALERLGTPWWRRAALQVFRDDASLPASAALWPDIEAALGRSRHLVLLASPSSAASPWIDREVRWWLAHREPSTLFIAVTAGEIVYDASRADFDFARSTCLPAALQGVFAREPHWVDLRPARLAEAPSLRDTRLRGPALSLAAALRGVSKDALENADLRQQRRALLTALGGAAVLAGMAVVALLAMGTARSESEAARVARLQAESRRLAAEASLQMESRSDSSRGVAIEAATLKAAIAWRLAPTDEARAALRRIADETPGVVRVLRQHTSQIDKLLFSRDGQVLFSADIDGSVLAWRVADGQPVGPALSAGKFWPQQLLRSRDGGHVLITGNDRSTDLPRVGLFAVPQGTAVDLGEGWRALHDALRKGRELELACAAVSPTGRRVALGFDDDVIVIDTRDGRATRHAMPSQTAVAALGFASDEQLRLVASDVYGMGRMRVATLDLPGGSFRLGPARPVRPNRCAYSAFSPDGRRVGVLEGLGGSALNFWQVTDALAMTPLAAPQPPARIGELTGHHAPAFDATGHRASWGDRGQGRVWDFDAGRALRARRQGDSHGPQVVLSDDGRLAAAVLDSAPVVWAVDDASAEQRISDPRCGRGALEDACIQRLCEQLTAVPDAARWRALLGDAYGLIAAALPGTQCAASGVYPAMLTR